MFEAPAASEGEGERRGGKEQSAEVIASPWLYSKWEVTLVCVEQRTDEVGLKRSTLTLVTV